MKFIEIDMAILRFFNQPFLPLFNLLFVFIIYSAYVYLFILIYTYFRRRDKKKSIHLFITSLLGIAVVFILKFLIGRPRPYELYPDIKNILVKADPAFPSAHTFTSFLCYSFLPRDTPKWLRYFSIIYLTVLIPFGSLYTGIHYPSDILFGAILGVLVPKIISQKNSLRIGERIFNIISKRF